MPKGVKMMVVVGASNECRQGRRTKKKDDDDNEGINRKFKRVPNE